MKFTAPKGKQVVFRGRIVTAKDGGFDTEDKDLIEVLKRARGVEPEAPKRGRPASDKGDE